MLLNQRFFRHFDRAKSHFWGIIYEGVQRIDCKGNTAELFFANKAQSKPK